MNNLQEEEGFSGDINVYMLQSMLQSDATKGFSGDIS